jgi:hypothetical protein
MGQFDLGISSVREVAAEPSDIRVGLPAGAVPVGPIRVSVAGRVANGIMAQNKLPAQEREPPSGAIGN